MDQKALDNRVNQLNPNNPAYHSGRDNDARSDQMNPNNDAYWSSRGLDKPTPARGLDRDELGGENCWGANDI